MAEERRIPVRTILACIWLFAASCGVVVLLFALRHLLFNLVVAVFLALVLSPAIAWLQRHRISRGWAITIVFLVVLLSVTGIAASIAAPLANQGANVARHAPTYLRQAEQGKGPVGRLAHRFHLDAQLRRAIPAVSKSLSKLSSRLIGLGRSVASAAARTAIVLVLSVFMLVEGPTMVGAFEGAIPRDQRAAAQRIGRHISQTVSSYTLGILMLAVLNGLVTAGVLVTMRVPFVLPLAMWAGAVDILPIVGGLLAMVVAGLFAFAKSVIAGIVVVVVMLIYQQVKNHLLYPIVVGRAVQLNSLIVLVAVLAGAELAGISGAILAIPVAAIIHVGLTELVGPRFKWLAEGRQPPPATPGPSGPTHV